VLATALDRANGKILSNGKSPSRKAGELDNRGSHFYLALYWAEALSEQSQDSELQKTFTPLAQALRENENRIVSELNEIQGRPVDIGGYYRPDQKKTSEAMRPNGTLNGILRGI